MDIVQPYVDVINASPTLGKADTAINASSGDWQNADYWLNDLKTKADKGDDSAAEKLFNYYASEASSKTARDWTAKREDTAYQRLMEDLRKAGISPYVLSGATPAVSSSNGNSYSGSQMTSKSSNERNQTTDIITKVIGFIGTALMALAVGL